MSKISTFILLTVSILVLSCKTENTESSGSTESKVNSIDQISLKEDKPNPKLRSQAMAVLDHRIKNDPQSYAIIEAGVLNYKFIFDGKKMSKPDEYEGDWIDFKQDFTYTYGNFGSISGKGRYHFSTEKMQLVMVDNDSSKIPQEWEVKSGGDVLIFVGTKTYGNNAFQMKLERTNAIPQ